MEQAPARKTLELKELSVYREDLATAKKESKTNGLIGSIYFQKKRKVAKKKPFRSLRIRKFYIKNPQFNRTMVFVCHPKGVHLLDLAVLHSESGCRRCRTYLEKQLF